MTGEYISPQARRLKATAAQNQARKTLSRKCYSNTTSVFMPRACLTLAHPSHTRLSFTFSKEPSACSYYDLPPRSEDLNLGRFLKSSKRLKRQNLRQCESLTQ